MLGIVLLLAGCTATVEAGPPASSAPATTPPATTPPPSETPTPGVSPTATATSPPAEGVEVTCDTMLDATVAEQYRAEGLAPLPKRFLTAHGIDVERGISCPWGPADAPGQQATHVYSWGPLGDGEAARFLDELQAREPFTVESGEGGTYLSTSYADGPGAVFFITDRSIRFAETKDALRDIVWVG